MRSLLLSRPDLDFLLHDWLRVGELTGRERFAEHSRETFDAVLDLAEQVATKHFAPHNRAADLQEPVFDGERVHLVPEVAEALAVFAQTGITGAAMDEAVGGMQLPQTVAQACFLWFQAANIATSAYPFLTIAAANLLCAHGSPEQVAQYVPAMVEGRVFGTMCLSEPQAGSSLADITTRAEPQPDGTYRLRGTKMWISGGEHDLSENIVHLVLAKIPGGPAGVKGISLFLVPRVLPSGERNDVSLAGLNHKMGYRGTVNTVLNFGERGGAVGHLVGEEHHGLAYMFHMMNEARVGVGGGAAALGYTGYLHAVEYARTRVQGRRDGRPVAIVEHSDVARMLLAQKAWAEGAVALVLYCARLLDEERTAATAEERDRAHLLLDVLTPVAKSWPSQWCLAANDLAIQVHGGYGYTRDHPVEQFYRDNRLNPIHEGTHGVQGLDLLGRKVVMRSGAGLELLLDTIGSTVTRARDAGLDEHTGTLDAAVTRVREVTAALWAAGDPAVTLANSSVYLEAVGHVVVAWVWLAQLVALDGRDDDLARGKRAAADWFFRHDLPRTGPQFALLESLDRTTLDVLPEWF
ncbi:MAG: acyl-CoA dehydrogenase [Pseudonocardiales bacterium]|nr:acyl-CoA dehydrogenase [Pseudonocardiales bacterium]